METLKELKSGLKEIHRKQRNFVNINNEGYSDGFIPLQDEEKQIIKEIVKLEEIVKWRNEWSKENTMLKRKAWNTYVKSLGEAIKNETQKSIEEFMGYRLYQLKNAVKHWGL